MNHDNAGITVLHWFSVYIYSNYTPNKCKFCHHLLTLMSSQNTKKDILNNFQKQIKSDFAYTVQKK